VNAIIKVPLETVEDNSGVFLGRGNVGSAKAILLKTVRVDEFKTSLFVI